MNTATPDEPIEAIFRPALFRGSRKTLFYLLLISGISYVFIEFFCLRQIWTASLGGFLACWLAVPALVVITSALSHYSMTVFVYDTKLVVRGYSANTLLQLPSRQEILFADIDLIFYLEKEYNLLLNYRHKLAKYDLDKDETDYRRDNLTQKYQVPSRMIDAFEGDSQKLLNDYTATGVLMVVEEILDRLKVLKEEKKQIIKELKKADALNYEYVARLLSPHAATQGDLDRVKDIFSDLNPDLSAPFLTTRLAVGQLESLAKNSGGLSQEVRMNVVLILSHQDGSPKVYLKRFHSLSRADWQKLIKIINTKKPGIRYLMPG